MEKFEETKGEKRKRLYELWINDFEGWADNQRKNCERMIERSRQKWETVNKTVQVELALEDKGIDKLTFIENDEQKTEQTKIVTPQAEFVDSWSKLYQSETGQAFKADKKDYILATGLIKKYGSASVVDKSRLLFQLCKDRSAWFTKGGMGSFTIGKLSTMWNEILEGGSNDKQIINTRELSNFLSNRE